MKVQALIQYLESIAPAALQENYDNSGLICGDPHMEITSAILCIDSTEAVIDEAIQKKANLVIAHHPIVFSGIKKFTGSDYVQRTLLKAIKNNVAIYAMHTNLDNVRQGVNAKIANKLGLIHCRILAPKKGLLKKLVTYCPQKNSQEVQEALFAAGAGNIGNYSECSFSYEGKGSFKANDNANPHLGEKGKRHVENESCIETIFPFYLQEKVVQALVKAHPYEEVAYDIYTLDNAWKEAGSGLIGELPAPLNEQEFLSDLKEKMQLTCIRHSPLRNKKISKVALCGGSGSFLLNDAIRAEADLFVTTDLKYHQFFDADNKIVIADIGHYESEAFTKELFYDMITKKITTFAVHFTEINTNPINYL